MKRSLQATNINQIPELADIWEIVSPLMREIDQDLKLEEVKVNAVHLSSLFVGYSIYLDRDGNFWKVDRAGKITTGPAVIVSCEEVIRVINWVEGAIEGVNNTICRAIADTLDDKSEKMYKKTVRFATARGALLASIMR
ncbi:MAG: hypothetical protein WCW17_03370 [Patescibacteria group bacterium]